MELFCSHWLYCVQNFKTTVHFVNNIKHIKNLKQNTIENLYTEIAFYVDNFNYFQSIIVIHRFHGFLYFQ
jgi:hypothetical protein